MDGPPPPPDDPTNRVHIFGQTLALKGGADSAYLQTLAAYVSAHMEKLAKESPLTPVAHVAMLASINIAHELFDLRSRVEAREADIDTRTREMLDNIEAEFQSVHPDT